MLETVTERGRRGREKCYNWNDKAVKCERY
jgi:hypothetical protein